MIDWITYELGLMVRLTPEIIAGGGVSTFIHNILVPELGARLIQDDLAVTYVDAVRILKETQLLGEKAWPDEEDEPEMYRRKRQRC